MRLIFLKLGGSLITDKSKRERAREEIIRRAAQEVKMALQQDEGLQLVLGHGSGSFGHFVAERYGTQRGIIDERSWWGYAETGATAARLNRLVTDLFLAQGVPVVSLQPSASARCRDGELVHLGIAPLRQLLSHRLVPLVYGDVALDEARGCTIISTEQIFAYLAHHLKPAWIVLAGDVEGVFTADPKLHPEAQLIPEITPQNIAQVEGQLAESESERPSADVTGGMLTKVRIMYTLVQRQPGLEVRLISGRRPGLIRRALLETDFTAGTIISK
ncbi:MAG: isopentenyl phosphate kinase [Candidatus Bipolaricaulia bacterium]